MKDNMFFKAHPLIFENARKLRNNPTPSESIIWNVLQEHFPRYKFRRQHPISIYIADIYCHKLKLVIEIDGGIHDLPEIKENDKLRQKHLEELGLIVLRFTNEQVDKQSDLIIEKIKGIASLKAIIPPLGG